MTEVIPIFAVPLVIDHVNELITEELEDYVKNIDYEPVHIGNGDWSVDRNILNDKKLSSIKDHVLSNVSRLSKDVYLIDDDMEFVISSSWILKHSYGDYCVMHNHTGSLFSGVFYIDADEGSGDIVFHNASAMGSSHAYHHVSLPFKQSQYNAFNTPHYTVPAKTGTMLVFSSGLSHSVKPNMNSKVRYSLSFNVLPKQMIDIKEIIV